MLRYSKIVWVDYQKSATGDWAQKKVPRGWKIEHATYGINEWIFFPLSSSCFRQYVSRTYSGQGSYETINTYALYGTNILKRGIRQPRAHAEGRTWRGRPRSEVPRHSHVSSYARQNSLWFTFQADSPNFIQPIKNSLVGECKVIHLAVRLTILFPGKDDLFFRGRGNCSKHSRTIFKVISASPSPASKRVGQ